MTTEQWQHWVFRLIAWSGGAAFVGFFVVLALQPRNRFKWLMFCFGWVWACFGGVFLLGAWQSALKPEVEGSFMWKVWAGSAVCLIGFSLAIVGWFVDRKDRSDLVVVPKDAITRACERHARVINGCALLGAVLTGISLIVILKRDGGDGLRAWMLPVLALAWQMPALLAAFVFLPRCGACGVGRMKITTWRPASYRCTKCYAARDTEINIANRCRH